MANKYGVLIGTPVLQSEPLTPTQVKNNAGGYVFALDDWKRLDRFLIIGSDSSTYYQKAQKLTRENAACVTRCYDADAARTVATIVSISDEGRAPKNDGAIFALAIGASHPKVEVRQLALQALPKVCRTSTHLFQFVGNCRALGKGWGRALKRAVAAWYDGRSVDQVAFQAIKYRAREGYTHKRLLETARPHNKDSAARIALYKWMKGKDCEAANLPPLIHGHLEAMRLPDNPKAVAKLVTEYKLPWEALPTEVTKDPGVWGVMLPDMGLTALIRNLGAMTAYETLKPLSPAVATVVAKLGDEQLLRKARIHPFNVLTALLTYKAGHSIAARQYGKTGLSWTPVGPILDALDRAFYASFKYVEPTGKRILLALDVSGSMGQELLGSNVVSAREAAAAMALVTLATEKQTHIVGFTAAGHAQRRYGGRWGGGNSEVTPLGITARQRLDSVVEYTGHLPFGGTDCALPMLYALENKLEVDAFVILTDNETWAGGVHPVAALKDYRRKTGIPAKLIVVGMTSTGFSIADPDDPGMLDIVGFDSAAPAIMAEFIKA